MKRVGNLTPKICTFENALVAYKKARDCKRFRPEVMEFEQHREENLLRGGRGHKKRNLHTGAVQDFQSVGTKRAYHNGSPVL